METEVTPRLERPRRQARHGTGSLFKQRGLSTWWMSFYVDGRRVRESTNTSNRAEAEIVLRERLARASQGLPVVRLHAVRFEELVEDLRTHYATTETRNLHEVDKRLLPLTRFFTGWRAAQIDGTAFDQYVQKRRKVSGTANGTINRERSVLLKMLRLALERGKLARLPVVRSLKEAAPRQGFFEPEQYAAVRRHLPADCQLACDIEYTFGWRMQSEVLMLERRRVDLAGEGRITLDKSKNGEGREVFLTPSLKAALAAQLKRVDALQRDLGRVIPFVFPHFSGRHRGTRRRDFRKAWTTACQRAGVAGRLRHDLRRTAVRDGVAAGVPERVMMEITGHKTRAVFDRYHIVSPADKRAASKRLADKNGANGHTFGHTQGVRQ